MSFSYNYDNYPSEMRNNTNISTRRSVLVEPIQNYHLNDYTQEFQDVEAPIVTIYNKQKNQIITKSPVKWYKNTRAIL